MSDILNACLCELNISTWTARKLDKNVSREVKQSKGAHSDEAARVNKYLMAGMNNLKEITRNQTYLSIASEATDYLCNYFDSFGKFAKSPTGESDYEYVGMDYGYAGIS